MCTYIQHHIYFQYFDVMHYYIQKGTILLIITGFGVFISVVAALIHMENFLQLHTLHDLCRHNFSREIISSGEYDHKADSLLLLLRVQYTSLFDCTNIYVSIFIASQTQENMFVPWLNFNFTWPTYKVSQESNYYSKTSLSILDKANFVYIFAATQNTVNRKCVHQDYILYRIRGIIFFVPCIFISVLFVCRCI